MACTAASVTQESSDIPSLEEPLLRGRRHSYHTIRRRTSSICDSDALFVRVDIFLDELGTRLQWLDEYRQASIAQLDSKLKQGYAALEAVRESCSCASSELIWGAAKQRAAILVETLEKHYNDMVVKTGTLEQKAQASMRLLETFLADLEARTFAHQDDLSAALDKGWKRVDSTFNHAREVVDEGIDRARRAKESLKESVSHALSRASETGLILYEDLPHPWRVNPHIQKGYRFTESKLECVYSIFKPSNETVNIWSHAIGLIVVLAIAFYFYPSSSTFPLSSSADILITACFFAAACKCLICSVTWHTMCAISDKTLLERFACVDYTGISLLVAASILSTEWTAFYCEPVSRAVYMTLTIVLGIAGTILPWHPTFNRQDMAWARVAFYISLAATGFAPVIQLNITRGPEWSFYFYAPIAKSLAVYVFGACVYAAQIPEKWFPGCFDYFGGSHNIWHLAVLGGILFHYTAMHDFFHTAFRMASEAGGCSSI
ncbi:MAG: hypothetical protein Q9160_009056 [Pyrenula sp. 1 TL-2023]